MSQKMSPSNKPDIARILIQFPISSMNLSRPELRTFDTRGKIGEIATHYSQEDSIGTEMCHAILKGDIRKN